MTIKSQLTHTRSRCESSCTIARKISHRWGLGRWTFMCCRRGFLLFSHGWASFFAGLLPLPCDKTKSCDNTRNEFDERTRNEKIKEIERQCHWSRAGNTSTSTRMSLNTLSKLLQCSERVLPPQQSLTESELHVVWYQTATLCSRWESHVDLTRTATETW